MTAAGRSGDNRAKDAVAAIVVSAVAFSIIGALIVYFSEWLYPGSTGLIDHATPHSGGNGSGVYVLAAAAVLVVALRVAALRKAAGLAIIVLGVMACSSGIGALLGVPMILVGGVMLFV